MQLCQFAANGQLAVAQRVLQLRERAHQAVRRFVQDRGALFRFERLEPFGALPLLHRKKALEAKPPRRQPRHSERRDRRAAARHCDHRNAVFRAQAHQILAGVGDGGAAGVGHQGAALTVKQPLQDAGPAGGLVVLVVSDQALAIDTELG